MLVSKSCGLFASRHPPKGKMGIKKDSPLPESGHEATACRFSEDCDQMVADETWKILASFDSDGEAVKRKALDIENGELLLNDLSFCAVLLCGCSEWKIKKCQPTNAAVIYRQQDFR